MGKAIGGYMRRCERVQGTIVRNPTHCTWCGISYADVRAGTAWHDLLEHPATMTAMPPLRFAKFDVTEPVDKPGIPPAGFPHGTTTF